MLRSKTPKVLPFAGPLSDLTYERRTSLPKPNKEPRPEGSQASKTGNFCANSSTSFTMRSVPTNWLWAATSAVTRSWISAPVGNKVSASKTCS